MRNPKEINIIKKPASAVQFRIGLVYPNTYQVGMSGLTIKLLYHLLNQHENIVAERIFYSPKSNFLPCSLENQKPLRKFDLLMFTVQFELDLINAINLLLHSKIPIYSKDRSIGFPLLIIGGPVITANPVLLSQIFDFVFLGEFEDISSKFLDSIFQSKVSGLEEMINSIEGFYKPLNLPTNPVPVITKDLDLVNYPLSQISPIEEEKKRKSALNGYFLQVSRGCPHGCHFCLIGQIFRPHRERSLHILQEYIKAGTKATQTDFISLIGSSTADYTKLPELLSFMLDNQYKFTLPSIRVDSAFSLLNLIKDSGQKSLTIAPETGNDELRRNIGKRISNQEIKSFFKESVNLGINQFKLYFILGLSQDINSESTSILELLNEISTINQKIMLNISITPFVPKQKTRLRELCPNYEEINSQISRIKKIRSKNLKIKVFPPRWAEIQAILSLGGGELTNKLIEVARDGGSYQSWKKTFNNALTSYYQNEICNSGSYRGSE